MYDSPSRDELKAAFREVQQATHIHEFEKKKIIAHFAYNLPIEKRFTAMHVKQLLERLHIGLDGQSTTSLTSDLDKMAHPAFDECALLKTHLDSPHPEWLRTLLFAISLGSHSHTRLRCVFYMPLQARQNYEEKLQQQDRSPEPECRDVSETLKKLVETVTDTQTRQFLDETMRCLQAEAYRAAIVMAWNLSYHHLLAWVVAKKLSAFNGELTTRKRSNKPYSPVSGIEDFPEGESFVVEVCYKAELFSKNCHKKLQNGLNNRNLYAHPTTAIASAPIAAGHVEDLLRHIVLASHFSC